MRPLRVFLCHASQDKPAVRELYNALKTEGWIDPWLDKAKILPGQDWELVIEKAVESSDVVITCLSSQSVTKEGFVQREIRYAYDIALEKPEETIFLIPLRLDDCIVPRKLKSLHWVDFFGAEKDEAYDNLLEALKLRYDQKLNLEADELEHGRVEGQTQWEKEELARKLTMEKAARDKAKAEAEREQKPTPGVMIKEPIFKTIPVKEKPKFPTWAIGLFALAIISFSIWGIYKMTAQTALATQAPAVLPIATKPPAATEMPTESPAATEVLPTSIVISSLAPTNSPPNETVAGSTWLQIIDGMTLLYIPAGEFTMGSDADDSFIECQKYRSDCSRDWFTNEEPPHTVALDSFWIDKTEVTNKMYSLCVAAGACKEPASTSSKTHSSYYGNSKFENYPVIYVDWGMAKTYCEWTGRRLPTEAEWEKAARGTDGNIYPWGNTFDGTKVNFCDTNCSYNHANKSFDDGYADVSPVGNYPSGQSVYGALDMAGNVWEWVNDWYDIYPGGDANASNNFGQKYRVLRGGSWGNYNDDARSALRFWFTPGRTDYGVGFRCARSP